MPRTLLVDRLAAEQAVIGRWRIEFPVLNSKRKAWATCLDCNNRYAVDVYELRRKDRYNIRCQSCNNKIISAANRLPPNEAILRSQLASYKKDASRRGHEWSIDSDVFRGLLLSKCYYCGREPSRLVETPTDSMFLNGLDRVDNAAGYTNDNCVTACKDCNYAKRAMTAGQFIELCERVSSHYRSRNGA